MSDRRARWHLVLAAWLAFLLVSPAAWGAFNNSTPRGTFAGNHNYQATGNTLRTQPNSGNACLVGASSTAVVSGIPAGATISAAYLYWGGSGAAVDGNVTFGPNGAMVAVAADATFTDPIPATTRTYFGGFKDVTGQVAGNGTYQFGGLTVDTSADYCNPQAVVAAWSLVVVYAHASEPYRYTRIYDGLQFFRGSSVTTTQSGFRVPDLLDGKVTVITWEGDEDAATSTQLDGFDEELKFDGFPLINAGCESVNNVYNSSISTPSSCATTFGVDIDTYDVTSYLYEGQTGATLYYASGNDRVFLAAQVISTTNTPVADLGITKTHSGNFTAGQNGSFSIVVQNLGPEIATGTATVTDVLPTGLSFVSGSGTGWSCSAAGQTVTCANSAPSIAVGASLPTLTLNVAVSGSAAATVDNTATVSHPMFDGTGGNQSSTDTVTILRSNLSTSTKTVQDVNGGQVNPGDVLRYTITLTDTGAQGVAPTNVSVVDDLPANVGSLSVISVPAGSTNLSVGSGGANGTGRVQVTGINMTAGGSVQIVFDVSIAALAPPGSTITNTAVVTNPSGTAATPAVGISVAASAPPASGNKVLYLYDNQTMTRTAQVANTVTPVTIPSGSNTSDWTLSAAVPTGKSLVLPAQNVAVRVLASRANGPGQNISVALLNGASVIGTSGTCGVNTTVGACAFTVAIPATTVVSGSTLRLRITGGASRDVYIHQKTAALAGGTVTFSTSTVINVDSVDFYTAPHPATSQKSTWSAGETVYIRATISDPFGGYDVSGARLTFTDPAAVVRVNNLAMTAATNPTNTLGQPATRVFEYAYVVPASPPYGNWIAAVTGQEGAEGTVTHSRNGILTMQPDALSVVKSHSGNFIAGTNASYTLLVNNTGGGTVSGTTTVKDVLATGLTYVSATGTGWTCGVAGQEVTCTSATSIPGSSSLPPITLTVAVAGNMGSSVDNKASVGNSTIASGYMTDGNTDTATILHPDLSTSTKTVVDLDGGDADPGDALRYTITLVESAGVAASNVSVVDNISGSLDNITVNAGLTTCNGTDASTASQLQRTGISLLAGGSCVIVFDVTISAVAGTGLTINNTATITNPAGPGATPAAPTVTVSASQQPAAGNKYLYVYANQTMSRVPHVTTGTVSIAAASNLSFTLPGVAKQLAITPGSQAQVYLWLQRTGDATNTTRNVYVQLLKNGVNQIGVSSAQISFNGTALVRQQFTINVPALGGAATLAPGDTLVLRVFNATVGAGRSVAVGQWVNTGSVVPDRSSLVSLTTATVVNVDNVETYAEAFPSVVTRASHASNQAVYFRATISDPFGGADVGSAQITITDNNGLVRVTNAVMTAVATGTTTRTFEYAYTMPPASPIGNWTASVTGHEGTEGMVSHTGHFPFGVGISRLTVAKSHTGNFVRGGTGSYSLLVHNNGAALAGTKTVTDTLPTGLTYVSGTGTGWSCGAAGQVVTCTNSTTIPGSGDLPILTLNVAVANDAPASVDNMAAVSHPTVNGGTPQNGNVDTTLIVSPDLSTSTKTVVDLDGGDVEPGDTLRYTILLFESAGAAVSGASVTDDIPAGTTGFSVVSVPGGAVDNSTGGGGANGTGYLDVSGINVAANASASIVFDVVVGGGLNPGDTIDNSASITNPSGLGATPSAPTLIVSQSQVVASGNKKLYLYDNLVLNRTVQTPADTGTVDVTSGSVVNWNLAPAIPAGESLVLTAGTINVDLVISTNNTVNLVVQLFDGATQIGSTEAQSFNSGAPTVRPFQVDLASDYTLDPGDQLTLRITNNANGNKTATIHEYSGAGSVITFATSTVVDIDSVTAYSEAFASGNSTVAYFTHGDSVWIRAVVGDPFGGGDVSAAEVTITDAIGAEIVVDASMVIVETAAATRTFEYELALPAGTASIGTWTASVTAHEGTEGTVSHTQGGTFELRGTVQLGQTWLAATPGDTVDLQVSGGSDAIDGTSTAGASTTPATAAATSGATITLVQVFTTGIPGEYTITLSCSRDDGGGAVAVTGNGQSRQITMPTDSSVTCTWVNAVTVPLTIVKLSTVESDPFNGTNNPKAIPGAVVEYQVVITNPAVNPIDPDTVVLSDAIPAQVYLRVADLSGLGSGPVSFADGSPASNLTYTFTSLSSTTDDVDFSDDDGLTWTYVPTPDAEGVDASVTDIRINPKGSFAADGAQFTIRFRVEVQ